MAWLSGYGYRQKVPLKRVDGAVTDYQMLLTVNKGAGDSSAAVIYLKNHALSWEATVPNDLRFTRADEVTELSYWIEFSDANTAKVWGKYNSIGTTDTYFCVYYGKSGDATTSNAANTWQFFEGFENSRSSGWGDGTSFSAADWEYASPSLNSQGSYRLHFNTGRTEGEYDNMWYKTTSYADIRFLALIRADYADDDSGILFRATGAEDGTAKEPVGYRVQIPRTGNQYINLAKYQTSLVTLHSIALADSTDIVRLEILAYGSALKVNYERPVGTALGTLTATDATWASGYIGLCAVEWDTNRNASFDMFCVGKYTDPEPTWGTWGSEETPPTAPAGRSFGYIIG